MNVESTARLRLASWNVHSCRGTDRRVDPERTLAVIDHMDADLIALQEVPTLSRHRAFRALLEGQRGYRCVVETTLPGHAEGFGNALLSRLPLRDTHRIDLGQAGREPRCAIAADIAIDEDTQMHVIAVHLGLRQRERREQLERIEAHIGGEDQAIVVMGDFNTWLRWPPGRLGTLERAGELRHPRSFPALAPVLRLDRIMASPTIALSGPQAWRAPGLRRASDHLPLVAEIALPARA